MAWLREKPEHELLFGQFELLWGDFSSVGEAPELLEYAFDVRPPDRENRYWRRWVYGAAAAVVLMVLVTVGFTISFANYSTGPNEQREVVLNDGSILLLNRDTAVEVQYLPWERDITLRAGGALFTVAHNKLRPFWVQAGAGRVRAVGTKFFVKNESNNLSVTLVEGSVLVNTEAKVHNEEIMQSQILLPGQTTHFNKSGVQVVAENGPAAASFDEPHSRLSFTNARLGDVVAALGHYYPSPIILENSEMGDMRISAYFDVGRMDDFVVALHDAFGIESYRKAQTIVLTMPKQGFSGGRK